MDLSPQWKRHAHEPQPLLQLNSHLIARDPTSIIQGPLQHPTPQTLGGVPIVMHLQGAAGHSLPPALGNRLPLLRDAPKLLPVDAWTRPDLTMTQQTDKHVKFL